MREPVLEKKENMEELEEIEIEYITKGLEEEKAAAAMDEETLSHFQNVFSKFSFVPADEEEEEEAEEDAAGLLASSLRKKKQEEFEESDEDDDDMEHKISKKQQRLKSRPSLAKLKTMCRRPEVVEVWDCTASDPRTLVWLKAYRNTIMVPPHWSQKRKYMQGKRGIDKHPFKLPEYIEATKISEIRGALQAKEAAKTAKQKQREKVRPKMHRMDIDYEVLHDAFFKYATKPRLTKFGDIYYEGKENELRMKRYKVGNLSPKLREALGMADHAPPPWLINMQRYGPPPSYPTAKIPGLNAPIPAGAQYGYHPGGWGKPPVDEYGRPLYGDFSLDSREEVEEENTRLWGELGSEDEMEEEEDEEEVERSAVQEAAPATPAQMESGIRSVASVMTAGMETPLTGTTSEITVFL